MEEASFAATQKEISKQAISNNKHLNKLSEIHKKKTKASLLLPQKEFPLSFTRQCRRRRRRHLPSSFSQSASKQASKQRKSRLYSRLYFIFFMIANL